MQNHFENDELYLKKMPTQYKASGTPGLYDVKIRCISSARIQSCCIENVPVHAYIPLLV